MSAILPTGMHHLTAAMAYSKYLDRIDPQVVLDHYGARNQSEMSNKDHVTIEVVHSCLLDQVYPHHANHDENPSAAMNLQKRTYACYSFWQGGLIPFIMMMEEADDVSEIVALLAELAGESGGLTTTPDQFIDELRKMFATAEVPANQMYRLHPKILDRWNNPHPYITEDRGISFAAQEKLRIGYNPDENKIVFPHFVDGHLVGYQSRTIPDRPGRWPGSAPGPKYKSTGNFPKSTSLYGQDLATGGTVVVVESPMSVAKALSLELSMDVVATFGAKVSDQQIEMLRGFDRVFVWFDSDNPGRHAQDRVVDGLYQHTDVHVVVPEEGKDLGDYDTRMEVNAMLYGATPAVLHKALGGQGWLTNQRT